MVLQNRDIISDDSDSDSNENYKVEVKERLREAAEKDIDHSEQMLKQKIRNLIKVNNGKEKRKLEEQLARNGSRL